MQGTGSAASSSSCRAADYSAAWDAAQQQKRQRCQVPTRPPSLSQARLLRAGNSLVPLAVSRRYLRDSPAIGWCDRRVRFRGLSSTLLRQSMVRGFCLKLCSLGRRNSLMVRDRLILPLFPCVCGLLGFGGIRVHCLGAVVWGFTRMDRIGRRVLSGFGGAIFVVYIIGVQLYSFPLCVAGVDRCYWNLGQAFLRVCGPIS